MVNFTSSEFLSDKDAWIYHLNSGCLHNPFRCLNGTYTVVWQRELGDKDSAVTYVQREQKFIKVEVGTVTDLQTKDGEEDCDCYECQGVFAKGKISFGSLSCDFVCLPGNFGGQCSVELKSPQGGNELVTDPLELALLASLEKGHIMRFGFSYNMFSQRGFKFLEFELARDFPMSRYLIVAVMTPSFSCGDALLYKQRLDSYTIDTIYGTLKNETGDRAWSAGRPHEFTLREPYTPGPRTPRKHAVCIHGARDQDVGVKNDGTFDEGLLEENIMGAYDVGAKLGYLTDWVKDELEKSDRRKMALERSLRYLEPRHATWMEEIKIRENASGLGGQLRRLPLPKDRVNKKDANRRPGQPWWEDGTTEDDVEGPHCGH